MKRLYLGAAVLLVLFALSCRAVAADTKDLASEKTVGAGYEGMFFGNFLQGASVRAWLGRVGLEGTIWQGDVSIEPDAANSDISASAWMLDGKVVFAPIVRQQSKFYVGVEGGWISAEADSDASNSSPSADGWTVGPLFGAEFYLQGLPELGFNFEVGYRFAMLSGDLDTGGDDGADIDLNGIWVTLGVHYYFW